jgi:hypothetical protein
MKAGNFFSFFRDPEKLGALFLTIQAIARRVDFGMRRHLSS